MYNLLITIVSVFLNLATPLLRGKIKLWVDGRKNWRTRYQQAFQPGGKVLWMHVSSLGEFEQGRPVLEAFRKDFPDWQIVLTFFSPSGFEMRKNYAQADFIAYLPVDSSRNARDFIDLIQPTLVIFVKYDFWPNFIAEIKQRHIPLYLIAALFRQEQPFFKWHGGFWRKMIHAYTHIFTQTAASKDLLATINYSHTTVCGDPRVDRVLTIAATGQNNAIAAAFSANNFTIVAGSSWEKDEAIIFEALQHPGLQTVKVICAPHHPSVAHIEQLTARWSSKAICYSKATALTRFDDYQCLVIDNVGMLNTLYRYGTIAYIGGGFGAGIHNTLEPAAYGLPVIFGPKYEKFEEAKQFIQCGGAYCVNHTGELQAILLQLMEKDNLRKASQAITRYMNANKGATEKIMSALSNQ